MGVNRTLRRCVKIFNPQLVTACKIQARDGVSRRVDTGVFVDSIPRILQEAKSPTVMEYVRGRLPQTGVTLRWTPGGSLLAKLFLKAAVYLGLRRLEWLFLTCHNSWMVFRLTKVGDERVLAFSPMIEISNSSIPFRAILGALLSVVQDVAVKPTILPVNATMDIFPEDEHEEESGSSSENDYDDGSGAYTPSAHGIGSSRSLTSSLQSGALVDNVDTVMFTASPASSSRPYWVPLHSHSIAPSFPPACDRLLRISNLLGKGSTGAVYRASMGNESLAVKLVEILHPDDLKKRGRLRSEFRIYLHLEEAYSSGELSERIAPQCYGTLGNKRLYALVMELHCSALSQWAGLTSLERKKIFALVKQLHSVSVLHGDIEPRNVVRTSGGGFLLIDFSESQSHSCPDRGQFDALVLDGPSKPQCRELRCVQHDLSKRMPSRPRRKHQ